MSARKCTIDGCERPHLARGWCKPHYRRWQRWGDPQGTRTREEWNRGVPHGHRRCRKCEQIKPLDEFYGDRRYDGGVHTWCKRCTIAYRCEHAKRPAQAVKNAARRRLRTVTGYGITIEQYDAMLAAQGGGCAVCGGDPHGRWRNGHIDHDHTTGKVRGILCHPCNTALGLAGEDPTRLRALAAYLEAHAT